MLQRDVIVKKDWMKKMKPLVILYVWHEMKVKQWNNTMFNEWEKYAEPRDN